MCYTPHIRGDPWSASLQAKWRRPTHCACRPSSLEGSVNKTDKRCEVCGEAYRGLPGKRQRYCSRKCRFGNPAARRKRRAISRNHYLANKSTYIEGNRRRLFNLTPEMWDRQAAFQQGACAICSKYTNLCIDHDHASGKLRGLLCSRCNHALGHMQDSARIAGACAVYLERGGAWCV